MVILEDRAALEYYEKDDFHNQVKKSVIFPIIDTTKENPILAIDWEHANAGRSNI